MLNILKTPWGKVKDYLREILIPGYLIRKKSATVNPGKYPDARYPTMGYPGGIIWIVISLHILRISGLSKFNISGGDESLWSHTNMYHLTQEHSIQVFNTLYILYIKSTHQMLSRGCVISVVCNACNGKCKM